MSYIALGASNFGKGWGYGSDRDEAQKIYAGYREAGTLLIQPTSIGSANLNRWWESSSPASGTRLCRRRSFLSARIRKANCTGRAIAERR